VQAAFTARHRLPVLRADARAQCRTQAACTAYVRKTREAPYLGGHGMCVSPRSRSLMSAGRKMSYSVC
jgi:hypothetical protein